MMRPQALHFALASTTLLVLTQSAPAQTSPAPPSATTQPAATAAQIKALVQDLSAADYQTRASADTQLRQLGWPAITPLLIRLSTKPDSEADGRIREIVQDIARHQHTAFPPQSAKDIQKYEATDPRWRNAFNFDKDPTAQFAVLESVFLLSDESTGSLDIIQRDSCEPYLEQLRQHHAWYELEFALITLIFKTHEMNDTLPAHLLATVHAAGNARDVTDALLAMEKTHRYTADAIHDLAIHTAAFSGDTPTALHLAIGAGTYHLREAALLLAAQDDWQAVTALPDPTDEILFDRAAAFQFSGQRAKADALLAFTNKPLEKNAVNFSGHHPMLLGRMDLAQQLFLLSKDYQDACWFLLLQRRYKEALDVIAKAQSDHDAQADQLLVYILPDLNRLNDQQRVADILHHPGFPYKSAADCERKLAQDWAYVHALRDTSFQTQAGLPPVRAYKNWSVERDTLEAHGAAPDADPALQFLLGLCREKLGDPSGQPLQATALDRLSSDANRFLYLARIMAESNEPDLALRFCDQACALDDAEATSQNAYQLAATVEQSRDRYSQALHYWRLCILVRFHYFEMPEDIHVYTQIPRNIAYCQAMEAITKNRRADVLSPATALPAYDPEDLSLTLPLIATLTRKGWLPEARALADAARARLNNILKDFPNSHLHDYLLAQIDLAINDRSAAQTHITRALQLAPQNPDYLALKSHLPSP